MIAVRILRKLGIALLLVALFLAVLGCLEDEEAAMDGQLELEEAPEPELTSYEVETDTLAEEITGLAQVEAAKEEDVYVEHVFEDNGNGDARVEEVKVNLHEWVEAGQPLLRLETEDLEHDLELKQLALEQSRLELERMKEEAEAGEISDDELREQELAFEREQLEIERMERSLEEEQVRAPIDGIVTQLTVDPADRIEAYETIATVSDPSKLKLRMEVSEDDLWTLVPGLEAEVEWEDGDVEAEAVVSEVPSIAVEDADVAEAAETGLLLEVKDFEEALPDHVGLDEVLLENVLLDVSVTLYEQEDALFLPEAAIREEGEDEDQRTFVYVRDEDDTLKEIDVKTGTEVNGDLHIKEGLEAGDEVVRR